MATIALTAESFTPTVEDNDIVLIDFWAAWCSPCLMFGPIYEKVSQQHPDIVFGKVDTDAAPELAASFGVRSIPTLAVFRDDVLLFSQAGVVPEAGLEQLIAQVRALDMNEVRRELATQQGAS